MKKVWIIIGVLVLLGGITLLIVFNMDWGNYESQVEKSELDSTTDTTAVDENTPPTIDDLAGLYIGSSENGKSEIIFDVDGLKKTKGTFDKFDIQFNIAEDYQASTISVTIDANTINTENSTRDEHLLEEGFFEVVTFPEITYEASSIEYELGTYTAVGEMNLVGKTTALNFTFKHLGGGTHKESGDKFEAFEGEFDFDRVEYGMEADGSVGDMVSVSFYTELVISK